MSKRTRTRHCHNNPTTEKRRRQKKTNYWSINLFNGNMYSVKRMCELADFDRLGRHGVVGSYSKPLVVPPPLEP
jgi:hypothetical protein